jgi:chromosome segregation ATPase
LKLEFESTQKTTILKYENRIEELNSRLESVQESHKATNRDLQNLINGQRLTADKWKEEASLMRSHYDKIIDQLKLEMKQYHNRILESEHQMSKSNGQKKDLLEQMSREKQLYQQLFEKCIELEKITSEQKREISQLITSKSELLDKQKTLYRDLDKVQVECESLRNKEKKRNLQPKVL